MLWSLLSGGVVGCLWEVRAAASSGRCSAGDWGLLLWRAECRLGSGTECWVPVDVVETEAELGVEWSECFG